ncbi:GNAT family N-acetyltransferase [Thalassospira sp. HF15]|uniref:GNAT family N-acetyltransferase n=1 Tax=Thalassospira sp. HF15 TaxID=2722755 RepID=UPI0014304983|nr:GNAT family N-acetyltransferase [Thalassospira sp. HF15]NIY77463.1 GNAT family N-acetyltransferase [Thalassospira sp. HF15]
MTNPDFTEIRRARREDAPALHAMICEIGKATGCADKIASTPDDLARDGFGEDRAFDALIAIAEDTPVAMCLFFPSYSTFRGRAGLYIQDLYVARSHRGGGFARRLVGAVAKHARSSGKSYIRLSVDVDNMTGQRFYEKLGMRHAEDEKIYILDGAAFDALTTSD